MISRRKFLVLIGSAMIGSTIPSANVFGGVTVSKPGKHSWGMVIDVEKCTECMRNLEEENKKEWNTIKPPCVAACDRENNVPEFKDKRRDPQWLRILKIRNEMPGSEELFIPVLCNHCRNPPCAQVCPTMATFVRDDGIVLIDFHRCIGCRYCIIACPYSARSFNFRDPREGLKDINPQVPTRSKGVPEKCTFCVHRIDKALVEGTIPIPACVEACPNEALVFGDLNDPESQVVEIVRKSRVIQLRANLGTEPKVYYLI